MTSNSKDDQDLISPQKALQYLKEGNKRFQQNLFEDRSLLKQVNETTEDQFPFATILSCIDSRVSAELVFDQGLGDIFSIRIAGNFVNEDILGSMEYGSKIAGSKLIVVLGHTNCGAIKGACDHIRLGNLSGLIRKIEPAVAAVEEPREENLRNSGNVEFVNRVSAKNVAFTLENIRKNSVVLAEMEKNNEIAIVGAMYNVGNGEVIFLEK